MRYIPLPQAPRNRGFTILLVLLWIALLLYIFTHPSPVGFILIAVFTVFILPMFILVFRLQEDESEDEALTPSENESDTHLSSNGHSRP